MEKVKHIHEFQTGKVSSRENIDLGSKDWMHRQKNMRVPMWRDVC